MGDLLGYARISTLEQNSRLQTDALKAAGCYRVFTDRASGALDERRELAKLFDQVRPGDTVVVWRLDRLGRSLRHLIDTVNALAERKVGFRSLTENIDTTTSGGKLVFHIFGVIQATGCLNHESVSPIQGLRCSVHGHWSTRIRARQLHVRMPMLRTTPETRRHCLAARLISADN